MIGHELFQPFDFAAQLFFAHRFDRRRFLLRRLGVARLLLLPGAREMPHTHPYTLLIIALSSGNVEMLKGTTANTITRKIGDDLDNFRAHAFANEAAQ